MIINTNLYPGGKTAALTMSYDDGSVHDERLIEIFNKYGIKGTFHVNNHSIGEGGNFSAEKAAKMYEGHELSVHTATHPMLFQLNDLELYDEVMTNKAKIEDVCGYTVRGMSYPFGDYNEHIESVMRLCGMKYSRTTRATGNVKPPENFLEWHPTAHHKGDIAELFTKIADPNPRFGVMRLLYIWGHSYEFDKDNNWNVIEDFCKLASGHDHIWYATNIEIYDYITAMKNIEISVSRKSVFNPSRISVWASIDGKAVEIKPGENRIGE